VNASNAELIIKHKNGGNLNLLNNFHQALNTEVVLTERCKPTSIEYNFNFVSWVAPHLLYNRNRSTLQKQRVRAGVRMKKAYTMLTWLYYLTFTVDRQTENKVVKFSFLPRRRTKYTLTKAPMAHKTFSKEQFKFQLHKCKVSIRTELADHYQLSSVSALQMAFTVTRTTFPNLETNTLFLKSARITLPGSDASFYSYSIFSRRRDLYSKKS
jgi:ribosomal protein S10